MGGEFRYGGNSRVTRTWDGDGVTVASTYDPAGRLATRAWSGGGVTPADVAFAYNALGDLTNIVRYANGIPSVQTSYEFARGKADLGAQTALFEGESLAWLQQIRPLKARGPLAVEPDEAELLGPSLETLRRMTALTHTAPSGDTLGFYRYHFDPAGQLLSESNHVETITYTHDPIGQLTGADRSVLPNETYSYDAAGNRTLFASSAPFVVTNTYTTGPANRILSDGEHAYTHDDEGNLVGKTHLTTGENWHYTFDHRNRLTAVVQSDAAGHDTLRVTFAYDPVGRRIRKTILASSANPASLREIQFAHDRDNLWADDITENGAPETVNYLYTEHVDQVLARHDPEDELQWQLTDRLNSVRAQTDSVGGSTGTHNYTSFGERVGADSLTQVAGRMFFSAREWDAELLSYHYRSRQYDGRTGRFLAEDPDRFAAGQANLAQFAANDPIGFIDPDGLQTMYEYSKSNEAKVTYTATKPPPSLLNQATGRYGPQVRVECHHIIPKFLGGSKSGPMVRVPDNYHKIITQAFRSGPWGYGRGAPLPGEYQAVLFFIDQVYKAYPIGGFPFCK